jgi:RNA polymerase sigma factor (sigma-70 family)
MKMPLSDFNSKLIIYREPLNYFAQTLTRNTEDANDLVQETMLKALIYESKYKNDTNLKAWLYTIMKNIFINSYRKDKKMRIVFDGSTDLFYLNVPETSRQFDPEKRMEHRELITKMNELPEDFKTPVKMFFEGYKYKEIADELALPIGTIKSRIFLGRKALAEQLSFAKAS